MLSRRKFTMTAATVISAGVLGASISYAGNKDKKDVKMTDKTDANIDWMAIKKSEWKTRLSDQEYNVMRKEGTERPWSSKLNDEKRAGTFNCAACALPLFKTSGKFDSGTGWPSFFIPIEGAVETKTDFKLVIPRTEYHCARCGAHQGHVFKDGPKPTGLRYCNNGIALNFIPS